MAETYYEVTKGWIYEHRTEHGSWTKKQIESLGIVYPPRRGWIKRIDRTSIPIDKAIEFEKGKYIYSAIIPKKDIHRLTNIKMSLKDLLTCDLEDIVKYIEQHLMNRKR